MRRFLSIWFPYWATDRWRRQRPEAVSGPLVLTAQGQGGVRLASVDEGARSLGLSPGMTLADARALAPGLIAAEAEPEADAASLAALADWCGRYSPWSATDGIDGIRLDITGCAHLFDGEAGLLRDAEARLARFGFTAHAAIADTPAAAWAWARYRPSQAHAVLAQGDSDALLPLPVAALRLPAETVSALNGLGLRSIGDAVRLPRGPLAKRLGREVLYQLDRLSGITAEPISPRKMAEPWLTRLIFAEPVGRREDMDEAVIRLLKRLCHDLAERGQGARRLELAFYRVDGSVQRLAIGASRPTHEPLHLARLFAERLETIDPGFGIEAMVLEATIAEASKPAQGTIGAVAGVGEGTLPPLIDRLQNRLGRDRVVQLVPVQSHVPERAQAHVPALSLNRHSGEGRNPFVSHRPVKLLARPEPIDAMAPVPDDPPLSFRWRRVSHRVVRADGPERIGPEWWKAGPGRARDYYRVEDSEGRRFWVYREGLYGAAVPPRWFLHGFFA